MRKHGSLYEGEKTANAEVSASNGIKWVDHGFDEDAGL